MMRISVIICLVAIETAKPGQETQPTTLYLDLTGCKCSDWTRYLHGHLAKSYRVSREDSYRIWSAYYWLPFDSVIPLRIERIGFMIFDEGQLCSTAIEVLDRTGVIS